MPKRMSFSMTKPQLLDGSKDVTRRLGWKSLRAGDRLTAVEKCMGLKKGETQTVLAELEVVSVRRERLNRITKDDVTREGYPDLGPMQFVTKFCKAMRCQPYDYVTRIEFKRLEQRDG